MLNVRRELPVWLVALIFVQMLPATLVAPAIRPLFAAQHAGAEGAMHAFMAVNMLGAIVAAPLVGAYVDRFGQARAALALLTALDAVLLAAVSTSLPTSAVLALRALEGAAHVGAATILVADASARARPEARGAVMGIVGAAIMFAVAGGSAAGSAALTFGPRAPFVLASAIAALVCLSTLARGGRVAPAFARPRGPRRSIWRLALRGELLVPVSAAFVGRFTVGCLVVTFSLFAHRAHGLGDRSIGLLFTAFTLPFAAFTYPAGKLLDRLPGPALLGSGAALYASALVAIGCVPTPWLPAAMGFAGICSALIFAATLAYAAGLSAPAERASVMSLVNAAGCLGMLLGPAAAGIVSALTGRADPIHGYRMVFLAGASSVVGWLGACGPWLVRRMREDRAPAGVLP